MDKTKPANLDEIFEKKYSSQFDFMKEKLLALTEDIGEIKREKLQKKERKQKEEEEKKIAEEIKKQKPVEKPVEKPAPAPPIPKSEPAPAPPPPTPEPYVFKAPANDILTFRQTFRKGGYNF